MPTIAEATETIPEYLLVKNPFTGKNTNVLPLFELMQENWYHPTCGPLDLAKRIQVIHDFTSTRHYREDTPVPNSSDINYLLILFRNAFEAMATV